MLHILWHRECYGRLQRWNVIFITSYQAYKLFTCCVTPELSLLSSFPTVKFFLFLFPLYDLWKGITMWLLMGPRKFVVFQFVGFLFFFLVIWIRVSNYEIFFILESWNLRMPFKSINQIMSFSYAYFMTWLSRLRLFLKVKG